MTCYDLYSLRDPTCCCACWENMRNGYGEKQSYSGYILNPQDYGADTFSPVDWFKEHKVKPGESSLSGVYGKCRCSRASCPTLTLMAELQQAEWREHLGSGLGSSSGTLEENAHRSRLTFNKYLLQAYCVQAPC